MKCVGIITMHRVLNYGSVLQAYATYKKVQNFGYKPVIIDYKYPDVYHAKMAMPHRNLFIEIRAFCINVLKVFKLLNVVRFLLHPIENYAFHRYKAGMENFIKKMDLTQSFDKISIEKSPPLFDIYFTGSDQTWNPKYLYHDYTFLLNFVPDNCLKISYAASFGSDKIAEEYQKNYANLLKRYNAVSVRESSGIPLVKKLAEIDAHHVLDPTMLLSDNEWKLEITTDTDLPEKFIFCYEMDYVFDAYPQIEGLLKHLSQILQMPVVFWSDNKKHRTAAKRAGFQNIHGFSPEVFLELYAKASFIVSNSFHGIAFAINFQKDFLAVLNPAPSNDDRVRNCLKTFRLESRGVNLNEFDVKSIKIKDCTTDHSVSKKIMIEKRAFSLNYLRSALAGGAVNVDNR